MSGLSQNEENLHVQYNVLTLSFVLCICLRISKASSKQVVNDWKCHVFDSNGLEMALKCACSKCIGRWPKTPQLLPTS